MGLKGLLSREGDDPTSLTVPSGMAHHHRKGTESTMSSSPPVEIEESSSSHFTSHGIKLLSTASSPASPLDKKTTVPPTLKGVISASVSSSLASVVGKQQGSSQTQQHHLIGHPTNSATPSLTVTPNSTADGSNFVISPNGVSFQSQLGMSGSSNFSALEGPSMPYLYGTGNNAFQSNLAEGNVSAPGSVAHHHRRGESSSFGSFDLGGEANADSGDLRDDNDGLFGLDALHYRVSSMHMQESVISPASLSPRTTRPVSYNQESGPLSRRSSAHSVRPPLSYSYADSGSTGSYGNERSTGSKCGSSNLYDSSVSSFGAIGQLRLNATEFDPNRRRSISDFNNPSAPIGYQQEQPDISQKFGTLPTLSAHIHQQQQPSSSSHVDFGDMAKPRHTRSVSQPVPPAIGGSIGMAPSVLPHDAGFYGGGSSSYDGKNSSTGYAGRSSLSQQVLSGSSYEAFYGGSKVVGMPMANSGYAQSAGGYVASGYMSLEQDFDNFHLSPESLATQASYTSGGYPFEGTYGRSNRISSSPGHSPHQFFYGNDGSGDNGQLYHHHSRQQSDNGILMSSSQSLPAGLNSGLGRVDDDLAHPLAGENIEVPEHDDPHGLPPYFLQSSSSGSHPLLRGATHSHSMSLDAIPTQQFMPPPVPKIVYAVKFKRSQRNFVLGPRISRDLKIGTYVKVEADRGEDLGIVVGKLPPEKFTVNHSFSSRSSFTAGMGPPPIGSSLADLKRIMRLATHDEVSLLGLKREEEEELLKICRAKVRQRGLPMNVVDAEYQFDRHKLTFFFEAMGRVDFRELVRDLFSMYKTRIWMQQLDKNTSTSAQAIVFPTANLQMDYGTPIIAPTSEFADSILYGQGGSVS
jgi:PSP1 C-terminal conserved region